MNPPTKQLTYDFTTLYFYPFVMTSKAKKIGFVATVSTVLAATGKKEAVASTTTSRFATSNTQFRRQAINSSRYRYPAPTTDVEAARFLQQATFSSTMAEIQYLRSLPTYEEWINKQIAMPAAQNGFQWLRNHPNKRLHEEFSHGTFLDFLLVKQFATEHDMLRKRVALAFSELFVVSSEGLEIHYPLFGLANYWDVLNRHSLGNYRNLLEAVTLSTAMGGYLNTLGNRKADPTRGTQADENYAREILQLFSIGLVELNMDGTERKDSYGRTIETYNQEQIRELAKVFTGYTYANGTSRGTIDDHLKPMIVNGSWHEAGSKNVFGRSLSGTPTQVLKGALDAIFQHPNVPPFIAKHLIHRLVTPNPTPAYVERVARVFANDGNGIRGNLAEVVKAVLLDDEARRPPNLKDVTIGKVREPMITFIQWLRTFSARRSASGLWQVAWSFPVVARSNQTAFNAPSVFNFFSPTYAPNSPDFRNSRKIAPELELVDENSMAYYVNYMWDLSFVGVKVSGSWEKVEIPPDYQYIATFADDIKKLVDHIDLVLFAGTMSHITRNHIVNACRQIVPSTNNENDLRQKYGDVHTRRARIAVFMALISPDYRVQK